MLKYIFIQSITNVLRVCHVKTFLQNCLNCLYLLCFVRSKPAVSSCNREGQLLVQCRCSAVLVLSKCCYILTSSTKLKNSHFCHYIHISHHPNLDLLIDMKNRPSQKRWPGKWERNCLTCGMIKKEGYKVQISESNCCMRGKKQFLQ